MALKDDIFKFLDIGVDRKRVFVTQLRDDEEGSSEDDHENLVQKFPVVKEKAGQLIEIGYKTSQKTLLLKRQADVNKVDVEFQTKKAEFKQRMNKCKDKNERLDQTKKTLEQRISKFEKFIAENDAKKVRALMKYEKEKKVKKKKDDELEKLKQDLKSLKHKLIRLKHKLSTYKVFEQYLNSSVDSLPEGYLESGDNMITSLMMRYDTLYELNTKLINRREELNKQLRDYQNLLQDSTLQASQKVLICNRELAETRNKFEKLKDQNNEMEISYSTQRQKYISSSEKLGQILLAIDNLAMFCGDTDQGRYPTPEDKLNLIKVFMLDKEDVFKMSSKLDIQESRKIKALQNQHEK